MTATEATVCPEWCNTATAERPCNGDHYYHSTANYMTASANLSTGSGQPMDGPRMPMVGVGVSYPEPWGSMLSVFVHYSADEVDESIDFQLGEAMQFYAAFGEVLGRVLASGFRPDGLWSSDAVTKMLSDIDAPVRALDLHEEKES